jgi:hypothetical protein
LENDKLQSLVCELESFLPRLKAERAIKPIANDCYEAACYWCDLGRWVLESNTKVNFPERAKGERMLLAELQRLLEHKSPEEQKEYGSVLKAGSELGEIVGKVQPPVDGHLGFLRTIRRLFGFLPVDFGFTEAEVQPASIRFSSGAVYLEFDGLALEPWSSCSFGLESPKPRDLRIQDLLYLNHDERYRTLPGRLDMTTEDKIEDWFRFIAEIFRQYGSPVLENRPGIFTELADAQAERDVAYAREMELKFGAQGTKDE